MVHSEPFKNTRELVTFINSNNITKENIISIFTLKEQLFLIYSD